MNINDYNNTFMKLWNNSDCRTPIFPKVSIEEKKLREEEMIDFSKQMRGEVDIRKLDGKAKAKFVKQFQDRFNLFFKRSFGFSDKESAMVTESGMMKITQQFMKMARAFDAEIKLEDVFQASRNLWIINTLQIMMKAPIKLSNSIFAYSMLYPYSDNYLDDGSISREQKIAFSGRFRQRLLGVAVIPANDREKTIFDLVALIEGDWDRKAFPGVYESLVAIHDGQTKSIGLQNGGDSLSPSELMMICIEKGGTSVLADGYLINGTLTEDQEYFCFGFGVFLQFVDDIQDIHEDLSDNLETAFTASAKKGNLETMVNRSVAFGNSVLGNLSCFGDQDLSHMTKLMVRSNLFLLTEAIALNAKYYSKRYVNIFEEYSAFSFDFVRKRRSNMESNRISLMNKMGSFIFEEQKQEAMQA